MDNFGTPAQDNFFRTETHHKEPMPQSLRSLTLTVTERCNLGCAYCYARHSDRSLSPELADAAVDWFVGQGRDQPKLTVSFYGGEPFLETELLRRIVERARGGIGSPRQLDVLTPTNGLTFSRSAADLCRDLGIKLAVSIDGPSRSERRRLDGTDSSPSLIARLGELLPFATLARVTVTPSNVVALSHNIKEIARLGFPSIVFQPAWEPEWDDAAVEFWRREVARIVVWYVGARAAGLRTPGLPNLTGIEERLIRGTPRAACGAGKTSIAVATDGALFPCFRLVYSEEGHGGRLGHVSHGITEPAVREAFASVPVDALAPEDGNCSTCPAKDGCTHYCPAVGYSMTGDPRGVPGVVCSLMRAEVEAVRLGMRGPLVTARTTAAGHANSSET